MSKAHVSLLRIDSTITRNLATRQLHASYIHFVPKLLETRVLSIQANYKYSNFERRVNDDIAALWFKGVSLCNKYTRTSQIVKSFERHSPFIVSVYPRHSWFDLSTYTIYRRIHCDVIKIYFPKTLR